MAETYNVENLEEALLLAQQFKKDGKYNLFRGQARNWPVVSSSGRLNKEKYSKAYEKLERLYYFLQTNLELEKFILNNDWFFAIAQHYGLPTNYIDFSESPEVAAYFATNSRHNKQDEPSTIICLNENEFNSFVDFTKVIYERDNVIPPYISKPNVDNLWRLHAQEGCFLYSPFSDIETLYEFDRIIFPYSLPFDLIAKEKIYPMQKSELEIHLDQYFNAEKRIEGHKRFWKFVEEQKIQGTALPPLNFDLLVKSNFPHSSWKSEEYKSWIYKIEEHWTSIQRKESLVIQLCCINDEIGQIDFIKEELSNVFSEKIIERNCDLEFHFNSKPKLEKKLSTTIMKNCSRIWDGTRNLPYSNDEIFTIIAKYVCFEIYEYKYERTFSLTNEELVLLELSNKYGNKTRCYASPSQIELAFRSDLKEILVSKLTKKISSRILLEINKPDLLFDFQGLLNLFKTELIPYQVLCNSESQNPVIFYTPTQITIMGYA